MKFATASYNDIHSYEYSDYTRGMEIKEVGHFFECLIMIEKDEFEGEVLSIKWSKTVKMKENNATFFIFSAITRYKISESEEICDAKNLEQLIKNSYTNFQTNFNNRHAHYNFLGKIEDLNEELKTENMKHLQNVLRAYTF